MQDYFHYKPGGESPQPNPFNGDMFGVSYAASPDSGTSGGGDWSNAGSTAYDHNSHQDAGDNTSHTALGCIDIPL